MKTAIIMSNMGGPDSLEDVQPYLENIFSDPDIIDLPGPAVLQKYFARWLAGKRAEKSKAIYRDIGGKSPLNEIAARQAVLLKEKLQADVNLSAPIDVFPAMRYWHPLVEDVWARLLADGYEKIVFLSMYPFYSTTTSGSLINLVERLLADGNGPRPEVQIIDRFGAHPLFIKAMAGQIERALADHQISGPADVLLSTHSIPLKRVKQGDPYRDEVEEAVELLGRALPDTVQLHLSYQSKIGPVKWLTPATMDKVVELAAAGVKTLIAYPFGFVADNSESVQEIGMVIRDAALAAGMERFIRVDALNCDERFIDALAAIVAENLD